MRENYFYSWSNYFCGIHSWQ